MTSHSWRKAHVDDGRDREQSPLFAPRAVNVNRLRRLPERDADTVDLVIEDADDLQEDLRQALA